MRVLSGREGIMEIVTRSLTTSSSSSSRKGVDRRLEGWKIGDTSLAGGESKLKVIPWMELESLRSIADRAILGATPAQPTSVTEKASTAPITRPAHSAANPDPMASLSFNLNLTESQQAARAQVPLPYAHEGESALLLHPMLPRFADLWFIFPAGQGPDPGTILYDPDSADDVDDDDPDEDLDI